MAREILLRFGTQNLQKARQASKKILKNIRDAARGIKDVEQRRRALAEVKSERIEQRRILSEERQRQRGQERSLRARRKARAFQGAQGVPRFGDPDESLIAASEGLGALRALNLASKSLIAIPIIGEVLAPLIEEFVVPLLRTQFEALERARLDPLIARLDRLEAESFERRLKEDIELQDLLARQGSKADQVLTDAIRSNRVTRSSRLTRLSELGG